MATTDDRALVTASRQLAAVTDEMTATFAQELRRVLRDLERRLRPLVDQALAGDKSAQRLAARAAVLRRDLRAALKAAGYDRLVATSTGTGFDALLARVLKLRAAAGLTGLFRRDLTRIVALKRLARDVMLAWGDEVGIAVWRSLLYGVYGGEATTQGVIETLADTLDVKVSEARTLYDTTTSVFTRQVEALKAPSTPPAETAYLFAGPADVRNRPFCQARVGTVWTRDRIADMQNGQLPNVFLTGGGYNCRHVWVRVPKASELYALVNTGERTPAFQAAVDWAELARASQGVQAPRERRRAA